MWWLVALGVLYVSATKIPKPDEPKPLTLADLDTPTAEEGLDIPVVFGTVVIEAPNVAWWGDLATQPVRQKTSKKG